MNVNKLECVINIGKNGGKSWGGGGGGGSKNV